MVKLKKINITLNLIAYSSWALYETFCDCRKKYHKIKTHE
jgi:hypothetical protein